MAAKSPASVKSIDSLLKAMLVFSRTIDHVLETHAVEVAVKKPLSLSKVQVLRLLTQRGSQTSSQVARFLGVSKPAVSQIIDVMVRDKQVTRRTSKRDRREVDLSLTAKGRSLFQAIRREQRHFVRAVMRDAGVKDPSKWIKNLETMAGALAQTDKVVDEFCLQCGAHEDGSCVLVGGDASCLFLEHASNSKRKKKVSTRKK